MEQGSHRLHGASGKKQSRSGQTAWGESFSLCAPGEASDGSVPQLSACSVISDSWRSHGLLPSRFLCPSNFSRQEYWKGLPFPTPGYIPHPGIEPASPALAGRFLTTVPVPPNKPKDLSQFALPTQEVSSHLLRLVSNCLCKYFHNCT